ncbi:MAG: maleylpyruvate isomerase N-terminal domain-containing protein [Actinobacteria bacterium]|nr:maleylpyruvate isomerase N-terminal domain-containing protein [Actinomycetota bacterium]
MGAWPYPTNKTSIVPRVERAWATLDEVLDTLSDQQMGKLGLDGWTVKDHLAHLAGWNLSLAALLESRHRQAALGIEGFSTTDWDGQNRVMQLRHRVLVPDEVRALLLGSRLMVLRALDALGEHDLSRPYREYQPQDERKGPPLDSGQPVARWVKGGIEDHVAEHLDYIKRLL